MQQMIMPTKNGELNTEDRLAIAKLLIKAGYKVQIKRVKTSPNKSVITIIYEDSDNE